jgi:hypothetical protein
VIRRLIKQNHPQAAEFVSPDRLPPEAHLSL